MANEPTPLQQFMARLTASSDYPVMIGVVAILALMILPLPPWMLDILLSLNITISVLVLLTSIYVLRPLDFSVFPAMLLMTTLFRLGLNVASTRLILLGASQGTADAGNIIKCDAALLFRQESCAGFTKAHSTSATAAALHLAHKEN